MLQKLRICHVALIDRLEITFESGLNVLTGETGAGKSIIIDAVNLAIGERANRELISHGEERASVEATFFVPNGHGNVFRVLDENGIFYDKGETGTEIVLSREITVSGRSVCRINGTMVNLAAQKAASRELIDIHGQHEHQSLLDPKHHLHVIDAFQKDTISPELTKLSEITAGLSEIDSELRQGFLSESERERRIDILNYQIAEIRDAALSEEEENELLSERKRLSHAESILLALEKACELLNGDGGVLTNLKNAERELGTIEGISEEYRTLHERIESSYYDLEDIAFTARDEKEGFEYDPKRLDQIEHRLEQIASLKRKYGSSVGEVLHFLSQCEAELFSLTTGAKRREELQTKKRELISEYDSVASVLTEKRTAAAEELSRLVERELQSLGMEKASFSVRFTPRREDTYSPEGKEEAEFMLSANAGEPQKPLSRVASGGEMARIMLALKTIIARLDGIDTLIFDEIDIGISGRIATVVGQKMRSIAASAQVISITHLPQIAAMADAHFLVKKEMTNEKTTTTLSRLTEAEHAREVARIMGGADSAAALAHAEELIRAAKEPE